MTSASRARPSTSTRLLVCSGVRAGTVATRAPVAAGRPSVLPAGPSWRIPVDQEAGVRLDELQVDTSVAPEASAVKGRRTRPGDTAWPYQSHRITTERPDPVVVPLVPYHRWARRGPSTMRIWLPIT